MAVFDGMGGGGRQVITAVGDLHADIVSNHVPVDARNVHSLGEGVVVDGKAGNGFHGILLSYGGSLPTVYHKNAPVSRT